MTAQSEILVDHLPEFQVPVGERFVRAARTHHLCGEGGHLISPGESYMRTTHVLGDQVVTVCYCDNSRMCGV